MQSKTGQYPPGHIYELTRPWFLSDLKQIAPETINELNQKSLEHYTQYCLTFVECIKNDIDFPEGLYEDFDRTLKEWARVHRLDETHWKENPDWVLIEAKNHVEELMNPELRTLYESHNYLRQQLRSIKELHNDYYGFSDTREQFLNEIFKSDSPDQVYYAELWPKLLFKSYGWNPFEEERSDAVERLTGEFKEYLQDYLDKMEDACRRRNIPPVPSEFRRKQQVDRLRFEWLIRFHVQGWSKSEIAQKYGVNRKAVQVSIAKEAEWVGLIPRQ